MGGPDASAGPACSDGVDNDGDGATDFPDDPGCQDSIDETEDSPAQPQCDDGRDNDGDGKVDFPDDPGCIVAQADSETDDCPMGPNCPQCANTIDDDGNGMADFPNDPGCESAADAIEFTSNPVACGAGMKIEQLPASGMVTGMLDGTSTSSIISPCGGGMGVSGIAYVFTLTEPKVLVASTTTTLDTVIDLRSASCMSAMAEITCNDDVSNDSTASAITASLGVGTYYLIVQGQNTGEMGTFELKVDRFAGEGATCTMQSDCGPGLVCREPAGGGGMICTDPVCSDGVDDDGDGKIDYPNDPGCLSTADDTEQDDCPSGPNCPQCADGTDNDGDMQTDYPADTGCSSASSGSEACNAEQDPVLSVMAGATTGDLTTSAHDDLVTDCGDVGGRDHLFTLTLPPMKSFDIDTLGSAFDTTLALLPASCTTPELDCNDDDTGLTSGLSFTDLPGGAYVIAVEGYDADETGAYTLNVAGVIAGGGSCEGPLFASGAFTCDAGYTCDGTAGSRTCRTQCSDGIDNNMDGKTDYPNDPGCSSLADNTETTVCPGAMCPQCADGTDNDGDMLTDYPADPQCEAAGDNFESCPSTEAVSPITAAATNGTTVGATDDFHPACQSSTSMAPDLTYRLDVPALDTLEVELTNIESGFDTVHAIYNATCGGTEVDCRDGTLIERTNVPGGTYFVVVDGWATADVGTFTLNVSGTVAVNGSCEGALFTAGALTCSPGYACRGTTGSRKCTSQCSDGIDNNGDGKIDYPFDPGCETPADDTEVAATTACSNTTDDDGDQATDFPADFGCGAAGSLSEVFCAIEPDFGNVITTPATTATLAMAADNFDQSCQATTGNDMGFSLSLPVAAYLEIDTNDAAASDTVLSLRDANCAFELACDDDGGDGFRSLISRRVSAGNYAIIVDGYSTSNNVGITLNVKGTVDAGAACNSPLFTSGVLVCPTGTSCTSGTCQ